MNPFDRLQRHLDTGAVGFPTAPAGFAGVIPDSPVIPTVTTGFSPGGATFSAATSAAIVMMRCRTFTFDEAMSILPTSGSVHDHISCGLGRRAAITGTVAAYFPMHVFSGTAETIPSGIMATAHFDALQEWLDRGNSARLVGVGPVVSLGVVNLLGITAFSRAEIVRTAFMWIPRAFRSPWFPLAQTRHAAREKCARHLSALPGDAGIDGALCPHLERPGAEITPVPARPRGACSGRRIRKEQDGARAGGLLRLPGGKP